MYYKFNKISLEYEKVNLTKFVIIGVFVFFSMGFSISQVRTILVEGEKEINLITKNDFSKEKLVERIKKLNFKFPEIVYAQALIESGNFKSEVFIANHNLFGFRQALSRNTTSLGTENSHAYYDNWEDSVIDRALYEASYLRNLSREEYLLYLNRNYAEAADYDKAILKIIKTNNLSKIFKK